MLAATTQNLLPILPFLLPNNMHSDAVMLQGHVSSSSPRLSSSVSPVKEDMDDGDRSCCSEDSVLSVGKEVGGNGDGDSSSCGGETKHDDENTSNFSVDEQSSLNQDFDVNSSEESMCQNNDSSLLMSSTTLRIPVPVVRPNPSRFQEEFIRKSQFYAEELMKQQMQFMAAARASAFTSLPTVGSCTSQSEFRVPNVESFHSHLNAISKLAAATNTPFVQCPSQSLNQLQQQLNHLPFINNNIHDQRLNKNSGAKKTNSSNKIKPMDLTSLTQEVNQTEVSSPISSPEQKTSKDSDSSSSKSSDPMVWPAWVYCTRYSDRPSS
uniref:Uncharacterized protein n=1 Tax=Megaselia scalaris TaxID=36166 RepID=T1GGE9_MEGSC